MSVRTTARPYQQRAIDAVRAVLAAGERSVCVVAPTGSGKTFMGQETVGDRARVVWLAHRRELVGQAAKRLAARHGAREVGIIMPGEPRSPLARIQVATVQTLMASVTSPTADILVLDEAHHYAASEYRAAAEATRAPRTIGLTAWPTRADGAPLSDIFGSMIVAAHHSELIADGYLVPARVYSPAEPLGMDLAQDPIAAWLAHGEGARTFVFAPRVDIARRWAEAFRAAGVSAECVDAATPAVERARTLARFRRGDVRVLTNVDVFSEGIDVPEVRCVVIGSAVDYVGRYLQICGRALRPSAGKRDAIVIDLTGASRKHGLPTEDRDYALDRAGASAGGAFGGGGGEYVFSQEIVGAPLVCVSPGAGEERTVDAAPSGAAQAWPCVCGARNRLLRCSRCAAA